MLRAAAGTPKNPSILIGLSDGNIERLRNGLPISADIRTFGVPMEGTISIIYGKTEEDILQDLIANGMATRGQCSHFDPRIDQEAAARREHKHILICTVGLPRSGKTTWAKSVAYPIVNPDSIRLALHGQRFAAQAEPHVWAIAKTMVRSLFLAGHKHVVLDATNTTRKRRDEWQSSEWGTFFQAIDTPLNVCVDRAKGDNEILPVIDRMAAQFEQLQENEKRW